MSTVHLPAMRSSDLVKRAIGIEDRDHLAIAVIVTIGHSATAPRHPGRRSRERNVFTEHYVA